MHIIIKASVPGCLGCSRERQPLSLPPPKHTHTHKYTHSTHAQELAVATNKMTAALGVWDASWGSDGPDTDTLPSVRSPQLKVLDGYVSCVLCMCVLTLCVL